MADQDGLVQVGSELTLEEPMAQDDTLQEDPPLQLNPEVALGVAAAVHEAPPKPYDLGQLMEMLNRMDGNMQAQRSDMQRVESRMDANAQKMNANAQVRPKSHLLYGEAT